jgi:hypothetical protein
MGLSARANGLNMVWGLSLAMLAAPLALHAQGTPIPLKPGLWEIQANTGSPGAGAVAAPAAPALPPEVEARIAAMPPAQQAQVRAAMAGRSGAAPAARTAGGITTQACLTPNTTIESLMSRSQQAGMQCSYSNKVQTPTGASFDISCTGAIGNAQGHAVYKMPDDEHMSSTMHLSIVASAQGTPMNMTRDISSTGKFVKADCGDVKPFGASAAPPK